MAIGKVSKAPLPAFYDYTISWILDNYSNIMGRYAPIICYKNGRAVVISKILNRNRHVNVNLRFLRPDKSRPHRFQRQQQANKHADRE